MQKGKKVITTYFDQRLRLYMEGPIVHVTPKGFLRIDRKREAADYVGVLPEFASALNGEKKA